MRISKLPESNDNNILYETDPACKHIFTDWKTEQHQRNVPLQAVYRNDCISSGYEPAVEVRQWNVYTCCCCKCGSTLFAFKQPKKGMTPPIKHIYQIGNDKKRHEISNIEQD